MLDKTNIRYALIITCVITVEIMLVFSFFYKPVFNDSRITYTYKETSEHNYNEYLKFLASEEKKKKSALASKKILTPYEIQLKDSGLVNVQEVDPDIQVGLRYSSKNNFVGAD